MLLVVRASDGAAFNLYKQDFNDIHNLDQFHHALSPLLEIRPDSLICMNEEGVTIRDDSIPHLALLAGTPSNSTIQHLTDSQVGGGAANGNGNGGGNGDKRIYVFDREHLELDPELVMERLKVEEDQLLTEPPLNPQDPLISHIHLSSHNLTTLLALLHSIIHQRFAIQIALSNVNRHLTGTSASLQIFRETVSPDILRWKSLLEDWEGCMDAIARVRVVGGLIGRGGGGTGGHGRDGSIGNNNTLGEKEKVRFLGDYVSREKMGTVRDGCEKVLSELEQRSEGLHSLLSTVESDATALQAEFDAGSGDLEDLDACAQDAEARHMRVEELVGAGMEMTDPILTADCFEELSTLDAQARDIIRFLLERKNAMAHFFIDNMHKISALQSDIATMPADLAVLERDLRTKTDNFKHLARLEGLIPAYVATVVEVVRRREYSRLLSLHSRSLSTTLLHLSDSEKDSRTNYRTNYSGKLPWDIKGLNLKESDENIPFVDFGVKSLTGTLGEDLPELGRETLLDLKKTFAELDADGIEGIPDQSDKSPIKKARKLLDELISSVDRVEADFKVAALSKSETRPIIRADDPSLRRLESDLKALEEVKEDLERQLQAERSGREEEVAQLYQKNSQLSAAQNKDRATLEQLKGQVAVHQKEKAGLESAKSAWEKERDESRELLDEVSRRANGHRDELEAAQERIKELERDLESAQASSGELGRRLDELTGVHGDLRSDHSLVQQELLQSQSSKLELETQLRTVETSHKELTVSLGDVQRALRDHRGEAELDRAGLEKEMHQLRTSAESKDGEIASARTKVTSLEETVAGLRQQVARWEQVSVSKETEVGVAKSEADAARKEREAGIVAVRAELERTTKTARAALRLAGDLRDENKRIIAVLNPINKADSPENDKAPSPSGSPPTIVTPPELDYDGGNLEELLSEVKKFDRDTLTEAVKSKVESLTAVTKKWSREAKTYRERATRSAASAADKIAFRNFTKGDLVLFLPTRNSTVPIWCAFNISFPHHFLQASGVISEQIKSREWIVARITSITEKLVDVKDPSTNPYLLAPGTKFFVLEVEQWSSREHLGSRSRKHSSVEKKSSRPEEKRSLSAGHIRNAASESSAPAATSSRAQSASTVIVDLDNVAWPSDRPSPQFRRVASAGLPSNATDLARSEFAIVEEESTSRPTSPTTLRQPVPRADDPAFSAPPASPSALALALSRPPPSAPIPSNSKDPFAPGPFDPSLPESDRYMGASPPMTDFEPTITAAGAAPAFLSSRKTASGRSSTSRSSPRPQPTSATALAVSPSSSSATGSYAFPRSAGSASSILSASLHRRAGSGFPGTSPPAASDKALATQSLSIAEDLASATSFDMPFRPTSSGAMTIGRSSKGWPSPKRPAGSNTGAPSSSKTRDASSASFLDSLSAGRKASTTSGGAAASEILKRLKPAGGS